MIVLEQNTQICQLNEMLIHNPDSLPTEIEQSIYYPKLKNLLHSEILNFCKEQTELRDDLNFLRMSIGEELTEREIREYLDNLKLKYNSNVQNVGIDYDITITKYDYSVPVFCVIKRSDIYLKKFMFRFKKPSVNTSLSNLTVSGIPLESLKKERS